MLHLDTLNRRYQHSPGGELSPSYFNAIFDVRQSQKPDIVVLSVAAKNCLEAMEELLDDLYTVKTITASTKQHCPLIIYAYDHVSISTEC